MMRRLSSLESQVISVCFSKIGPLLFIEASLLEKLIHIEALSVEIVMEDSEPWIPKSTIAVNSSLTFSRDDRI